MTQLLRDPTPGRLRIASRVLAVVAVVSGVAAALTARLARNRSRRRT